MCEVMVDGVACNTGQRIILGRWCAYHYRQQRRGVPFTAWRPRNPRGTGQETDGQGRRRCLKCLQFTVTSARGYWCDECSASHALLKRYGITRAQADEMLAKQGGVCAICGTDDPAGRQWQVDHDHACCPGSTNTCGKCVRGILCANCNRMLGSARDDAAILAAAIEYLKQL